MPYNWLTISNTPPEWEEITKDPAEFRRQIIAAVEQNGGKVETVLWAVGRARTYALTVGPTDPVKQKALMKALPILDLMVLLDVDETLEAFGPADPEAGY